MCSRETEDYQGCLGCPRWGRSEEESLFQPRLFDCRPSTTNYCAIPLIIPVLSCPCESRQLCTLWKAVEHIYCYFVNRRGIITNYPPPVSPPSFLEQSTFMPKHLPPLVWHMAVLTASVLFRAVLFMCSSTFLSILSWESQSVTWTVYFAYRHW